MRALRKEDIDGTYLKKHDISTLRSIAIAGERCDVPTYEWIRDLTRVLINDNYWQTETGWVICGNF